MAEVAQAKVKASAGLELYLYKTLSAANWKVNSCRGGYPGCDPPGGYDTKYGCFYYDRDGVLPSYASWVLLDSSDSPSFAALDRVTNPLDSEGTGLGASYQNDILVNGNGWNLQSPFNKSVLGDQSRWGYSCGYSSAAPQTRTTGVLLPGNDRIQPTDVPALRPAIQAIYDDVNASVENESTRKTLLAPLAQALHIVDDALVPFELSTPDHPGGSGGSPSRLRARDFLRAFVNLNRPGIGEPLSGQAIRFAAAANNVLAVLETQSLASNGGR